MSIPAAINRIIKKKFQFMSVGVLLVNIKYTAVVVLLMASKSLVNVKKQPLKRITRFDAMRKNHEAFHFEIGDYKITIRFEYIGDMGVVHHILGNGKTYKRYAKDKVGMVYRTYKYYVKTKSYKTTKGYKFEPIGAEYAKLFGIYKEPDFISVSQAMKEINTFREGVNPFQRMTTKYK